MPNKNTSKDSKDSATKRTLNPTGSDAPQGAPDGAPPHDYPSNLTNERDPDDKIGQFTGRGSPGLQKR